MELRCPLILNGIHNFTSESDLISRCITIDLNPIGSEQRRTESELVSTFEEDLPSLVYTLHAIAAKILAVKDSAEVLYQSRMADFSVWVAGLEVVLGQKQGTLQLAYERNIARAKETGVADDSLYVALSHFARRYTKSAPWHGTPHSLLAALEAQTVIALGSDMPKSAAAMSRRITDLKDSLNSNGIRVERGRATDRYFEVWFESPCEDEDTVDDAVEATVHPAAKSSQLPDTTSGLDVAAEELLG